MVQTITNTGNGKHGMSGQYNRPKAIAGAPTATANAEPLKTAPADQEQVLQQYIDAAWRFGKSVLWKGVEHTDEEERAALGELDQYFRNSDDVQEAFEHFVGSVMMAEANKKKCPILRPLQWLIQANTHGLMNMALRPRQYNAIMKKVPLFETLVKIIAKHYLEFIKNPTVKTVLSCSDELQGAGGKGWMRIFYE
jgi:hypothetical protein